MHRPLATILLAGALSSPAWSDNEDPARWYRYYNDKNQPTITDRITEEHISRGYEALDKGMQLVRKVPPQRALTPAEVAAACQVVISVVVNAAQTESVLFGEHGAVLSRLDAMQAMRPYIEAHLASGGSLHHITRHMLGLAQGFKGARRFRQLLSVDIHKTDDPLGLFDQAAQLLQGH